MSVVRGCGEGREAPPDVPEPTNGNRESRMFLSFMADDGQCAFALAVPDVFSSVL